MAAGPTPKQLYSAKRRLCILAEYEAKAQGYDVRRYGARGVDVFSLTGVYIGTLKPKVLRASNGEACVLLETTSPTLQGLV